MISLKEYRQYWERAAVKLEIPKVYAITIDKEMARKIQAVGKGETVLFWLPPAAKSEGSGPDSFTEENSCVVFVMVKYDAQRESSLDALEKAQPVAERVKGLLIGEAGSPCSPMRPDLSTIDTLPETDFYGTLAGWSIGFRINSNDYGR